MVRKEAPIASHLIYTRLPKSAMEPCDNIYQGHVVDNGSAARHGREHGIQCGFAWNKYAEICAVYMDYGISEGMKYGIAAAEENGTPIEYRRIYETTTTDMEYF
jgi:hypothetical protein